MRVEHENWRSMKVKYIRLQANYKKETKARVVVVLVVQQYRATRHGIKAMDHIQVSQSGKTT